MLGCIKTSAGKKRYLSLCYAKADIGVIAPLGEAADERVLATGGWSGLAGAAAALRKVPTETQSCAAR